MRIWSFLVLLAALVGPVVAKTPTLPAGTLGVAPGFTLPTRDGSVCLDSLRVGSSSLTSGLPGASPAVGPFPG